MRTQRFLFSFSFTLFILLALNACGQPATRDSAALAEGRWRIDTVDGMVLKTAQFSDKEIFGSNQCFALLEIPPQSPCRLSFTCESRRTTTSTQACKYGALAAVNGSFFDMSLHNPICYLRINGQERGVNTPGADTVNRKYYQYGTLVLYNGRPKILRTQSARMWERGLKYTDIMTAGPLLLYEGKLVPQRDDRTFITQRHNRTALGIRPDGTVILFTVDGRMKESAGMSIPELAKTMKWLGCTNAINFDGGGSTTLWLKNNPLKRISGSNLVTHPSDNNKFDYKGERAVSNCIIVVKGK